MLLGRLPVRIETLSQIYRLAHIQYPAAAILEKINPAGPGNLAQGRGQTWIKRSGLYFDLRHLIFYNNSPPPPVKAEEEAGDVLREGAKGRWALTPSPKPPPPTP
jgi:hypothetical protein